MLDSQWALAPALRDTIGKLYQQRQAAFIPFAGTDDLTRSHFDTQDSIELGQPVHGARNYGSGFLSRLAETLNGPNAASSAISFTDSLPLVFRGHTQIFNQALRRVDKPGFDARQSQILAQMYAGQPLGSAVSNGLQMRQEVARKIAEDMQAANRDAISTKGFELEAERMAYLMRDNYRIGFVDVGGWDTHVNEGGAAGTLANNLASLGSGLSAYANGLGDAWRDTVVVVLSEFGRTFAKTVIAAPTTDMGRFTGCWAAPSMAVASPASSRGSSAAACFRTGTTRCSTTIARCSAACSARSGVCRRRSARAFFPRRPASI